ncbi:redox-regulated ATPase YchF [Thermodesulfovibrio sp. 3907-1M]|uniref:Redox-regulated ATPase YchF n=1 Tax=Thermodesulfovibrio autotrophicus TaxID=3118333 RepID=A0AAU8H1T0_9BACT
MKIALTGFFNSGKTTIFNAMTHQKIETSSYSAQADKVHVGVLQVDDPRLRKISEIVNPKKTTFAQVECIDVAGLIKDNPSHNSKVIKQLIDADALIYILRGFEDLSVPYQFNTIDPVRDFNELEYEFIMIDLDLVTKRIERMSESKKKGQKINEAEMKILQFLRNHLEEGKPLRTMKLKEEEIKQIRHLNFLTLKPAFAVINADENSFNEGRFKDTGFLTICGLLESEIIQLPQDEISNFLDAMGIDEPVSKKIIRKAYEILDYISFFTAGPQEVRAWSIKKGTLAVDAAGKIHSDIQRGFIRAEVISYNDFLTLEGDLNLAKQKGVLRLEGKEYEVKDGDIITFRFKV